MTKDVLKNQETVIDSFKTFFENNQIDERDIVDDDRLDNFEQKVKAWLNNVETEEEKQIFLVLLKNYSYYNKLSIAQSFINGFNMFKKIETYHNDTIYMGVGSRGGIFNGSSELIPIFKRSNKIDKLRIVEKPRDFYEKYDPKDVKNVVLVDDIIGSGTTVKRYLEENLLRNYPELILGKKIYIICVIALEKGLSTLNKFAVKNNLFLEVINEYGIEKAFDKNKGIFISEKERINAKKIVRKYDEKIVKREIDILGFKESQGLVSFYHNTPNNTFPIFWEDPESRSEINNTPWSPIFGRDEGISGLPEREIPTHKDLGTIKKEKEFKDRLLSKILKKLFD
ncbi:phosphoribosyltransferase [Neobacillus massiliamazoniensis]|uniref:PRTase-CE domain-containing protein n=1 Tax=Neobacillus massiliamazoniensis TaxID=1499688 RepID=A0A0U1NYC7_9BACI|nr:phosphoribosyltransferase [Neobacillus massiliamazoniensis]CRK83034.1 hypothetical protein BN000_02989 [Neobacillus massiliamazoniensis]